MFIPNKTYHAMRVVVTAVIAALLVVIAGQTVLYTQLEKDTQVVLDSLSLRIDELGKETRSDFRNTDGRQDGAEEQIFEAKTSIEMLQASVTELQSSLGATRVSVEKLQRNECTPETAIYVLTKDMVAVCRTLGVLPQ